MNEKFTRGEWSSKSGYSISSKGHGYIAKALPVYMDSSERKANADLIAAAPKMYRLLQKFIPMDDDGNGEFIYSDGSECMGDEVNALLAEARGESKDTD